MLEYDFEQTCISFLCDQIEGLTDTNLIIKASEWAEKNRYLPPSVTSQPGFYSFEVAPYIREILDCFSLSSPVREAVVMKGVQLCLSVGVLENIVGYEIEHVKTSPCMLITSNIGLAETVIETRIITMIQNSNLDHLVKSNDEKSTKKTGRTVKKIEWAGGGFLLPHGANSPGDLRSMSMRVLLFDEVDSYKKAL